MARAGWRRRYRWRSRFAGWWVILEVATPLTRLSGAARGTDNRHIFAFVTGKQMILRPSLHLQISDDVGLEPTTFQRPRSLAPETQYQLNGRNVPSGVGSQVKPL